MGDCTHIRVVKLDDNGNLDTQDSFENLDSGDYLAFFK